MWSEQNKVFRVCGRVSTEPTCASVNGSLCQYDTTQPSPLYRHKLIKWDNTGVWSLCDNPTLCPSTFGALPFSPSPLAACFVLTSLTSLCCAVLCSALLCSALLCSALLCPCREQMVVLRCFSKMVITARRSVRRP